MGQTRGQWLRTDELNELITTLEYAAEFAERVSKDIQLWKWVIIAMHNALQGACVCALRGHDTSGLSVLEKKSAREMWHWLYVESRKTRPGPVPREQLASLLILFKRVQNAKYLPEPHSLPRNKTATKEVKTLNILRNEFIHFVPKGFSLGTHGLPSMIIQCCDVIEHLAVINPTFSHHLTGNKKRRIKTALKRLRDALIEEGSGSAK